MRRNGSFKWPKLLKSWYVIMFSLLLLSFLNFFPAHRRYKAFPPQLILMTIQSFHQTERRFIQGYQGKFRIMNTPVYHQIWHTTLLDWFKILLSSVTRIPVTRLPAYTDVFCLASQHKYNHSWLLEQMITVGTVFVLWVWFTNYWRIS